MAEAKEVLHFTPLSDDEIKVLRQRLLKIERKHRNDIIDSFAKSLKQVVLMAKKACKKEDEIVELDRVRRILNILPNDDLFLFCHDKIWLVREQIKKRNVDFFMNVVCDIPKDDTQDLVFALIELVRDNYNKLSAVDKDAYWKCVQILLDSVDRFIMYKPYVPADNKTKS